MNWWETEPASKPLAERLVRLRELIKPKAPPGEREEKERVKKNLRSLGRPFSTAVEWARKDLQGTSFSQAVQNLRQGNPFDPNYQPQEYGAGPLARIAENPLTQALTFANPVPGAGIGGGLGAGPRARLPKTPPRGKTAGLPPSPAVAPKVEAAIPEALPKTPNNLNSLIQEAREAEAQATALEATTGASSEAASLRRQAQSLRGRAKEVADAIAKLQDANLPPVPEGYIRLYRGERGIKARPIVPSANAPMSEYMQPGTWFTPHIEDAAMYGPDFQYLDVPEAVAREASRNPREVVLSIERAAKAKPISISPEALPKVEPPVSKAVAPPVKPPIEPPVTTGAVPPEPDIAQVQQKVLDIITEQKGLRKTTSATQRTARSPKFATIEELRKSPKGEASMAEVGAALKGELGHDVGTTKVVLSQTEKDLLHNSILSSKLTDAEILPSQKALLRITDPTKFRTFFPEEHFDMPLRDFEIKYFEKVWGKEFADKLRSEGKWLRAAMKTNDILAEIFYNNLLGGKAIVRNLGSNILRMVVNPLDTAGAVIFSLLTKQRRGFGEVSAEMYGSLRGIEDGGRAALKILKTGERFAGVKTELAERAIPGKAGRIIGIPSTLMEAGDALLYRPLEQGLLEKFAFRQAKSEGLKGAGFSNRVADLVSNPSEQLLTKAKEGALEGLFRNQHPVAQLIIQFRDKRWLGFQPLRIIVPFVNVPFNVAGYGLAHSPIAILNPKLWVNIAKRNPQAADQMGKWLTGSMVAGTLGMYFAQGRLTGAPPTNPAERDRFYRDGKQPFSAKIGNTWVSYQQIPVIGTTLAMVAEAAQANAAGDKSGYEKTKKAVYGVFRNTIDQTSLTGLSDFLDAITDPDRYADTWLKRTLPSLAPVPFMGPARLAAQAIDTTVREPKTAVEGFKAQMPGLSKQVPSRLTVLGEEITRATPAYSPVNISPAKETELTKELDRLKINIGFVGSTIGGVKLTEEQKRRYQEESGQLTKQELSKLISSLSYRRMTDEKKESAIDKVVRDSREKVRKTLQKPTSTSSSLGSRLRQIRESR